MDIETRDKLLRMIKPQEKENNLSFRTQNKEEFKGKSPNTKSIFNGKYSIKSSENTELGNLREQNYRLCKENELLRRELKWQTKNKKKEKDAEMNSNRLLTLELLKEIKIRSKKDLKEEKLMSYDQEDNYNSIISEKELYIKNRNANSDLNGNYDKSLKSENESLKSKIKILELELNKIKTEYEAIVKIFGNIQDENRKEKNCIVKNANNYKSKLYAALRRIEALLYENKRLEEKEKERSEYTTKLEYNFALHKMMSNTFMENKKSITKDNLNFSKKKQIIKSNKKE